MNRDKIRERIRNGSIRDPVNAADGPPIYHATRSNGKPLRVAYYRHVKSDHLDTSIYYELETHCARQWISARTDWELKGVFLDTNGSWAAYEEMKAGKYDLIVARTAPLPATLFQRRSEPRPEPGYRNKGRWNSPASSCRCTVRHRSPGQSETEHGTWAGQAFRSSPAY